MPLRPLRAREIIRRLERAGFVYRRQSGSHARYVQTVVESLLRGGRVAVDTSGLAQASGKLDGGRHKFGKGARGIETSVPSL